MVLLLYKALYKYCLICLLLGDVGNKRMRMDDEAPTTPVRPSEEEQEAPPPRRRRALNGNVEVIEIQPETADDRYDLIAFLRDNREKIKSLITQKRQEYNLKFYLAVQVRMVKYAVDGTFEEQSPYFRSNVKSVITSTTDDELDHDLNESYQKIFAAMEEFLKNGSGYQMEEVLQLEVTITKYSPLTGGTYMDLPATLNISQSLINVMSQDECCFMWSILASLHPAQENPELLHHYLPFQNTLDMTDISFPTPLTQIGKFEKHNQNISVSVFGFEEEDKEIFPLHITKKDSVDCHHVNLLMMKNGDGRSHYVLIRNFNRFLSRTKKVKKETFFCHRCLQGFTSARVLSAHEEVCRLFDAQKISLPKEGEVLEFKEYAKIHRHPFVIYADFECLTRKLPGCENNPDCSGTQKYQQMEPFSFAYQRVSTDPRYQKEMVTYRGPRAVQKFLDCMLEEEDELMQLLHKNEPLEMNEFIQLEYERATKCFACQRPFSQKNYKVFDHDHLTSELRGISCNDCNLKMKQPTFIPVLLHNLRGFDANLIMSEVGKYKDRNIKVIPHNKEKYLSFSLGHLRFIDSLLFLNESLAKLTDNLAEDGVKHFNQLQKCFPNPDHFTMMLRKGVFPYDYVDCEDKLDDTKLPEKQAFDSKLTGDSISDEDYKTVSLGEDGMQIIGGIFRHISQDGRGPTD